MKPIASIQGHYEILNILQIALFRDVFQKSEQCFYPSSHEMRTRPITAEMKYIISCTHEPSCVVTHSL